MDDPTSALAAEIARLTDQARRAPDAEAERRLVELRHQAFLERAPEPGRAHWPPEVTDPFPDVVGRAPEVAADRLDAGLVSGAIVHHGCLLVRSLVPASDAERLADGIDRAFAASDADLAGDATGSAAGAPWYVPFRPRGATLGNRRRWVRAGGAVWAADAPRVLLWLVDALEAVGLPAMIAEHLGERPALSVNKCALRRVGPDARPTWHQDGSFLGEDVRTVNVWIALTRCGPGTGAPGIDIVPRRIDELVEVGTPGAPIQHAVAPDVVRRAAGDVAVQRPVFEVGDALLFDDRFLHRTGVDPDMTELRRGIECWTFAPSRFPDDYVPLVL